MEGMVTVPINELTVCHFRPIISLTSDDTGKGWGPGFLELGTHVVCGALLLNTAGLFAPQLAFLECMHLNDVAICV